MCKTELLEHIIALVAQLTELSAEQILSKSRRTDIVDARYIAVAVMLKKNISVYRIAPYMNMSERNVYRVAERFDDRKDYGDPMIEYYYNSVLEAVA